MIHIPSFTQSRAVIHFPALRFLWMILFVFLFPFSTLAQQYITINGKAMDEDHPAFLLEQVMVINLRTQQGIFGNADNSFSISIEKNDTLVITALGYRSDKICFRDSVLKDFYTIIVPLKKISITLKEATIFIPRDLSRIEEDIKKLGYSSKDYRLSGVDAWQSPITALYQEFSRKERSKRRVAELMNEDRRRDLLREILANYSRAGLIEMKYNEYNAFIDYLGLSEFLMKSLTQYELAVYIKEKYYNYMEQ
jgi:hypothetical protein